MTVDFETLDDHAVTVRERDTMAQERVLDRRRSRPTSPSVSSAADALGACTMAACSRRLGSSRRCRAARRRAARRLLRTTTRVADVDGAESPALRRRPASASATPYLPVPDGVELTPQGSQLAVGDTATVAYEPRQGVVGVARHHGHQARADDRSRSPSSAGSSTPEQKKSTPYFVRATIKNVGDTDLGGRRSPLYVVDEDNTAAGGDAVRELVHAVPEHGAFPEKFAPGADSRRSAWSTSRPTTASSTRSASGPRRRSTRSPGPASVDAEVHRSPPKHKQARHEVERARTSDGLIAEPIRRPRPPDNWAMPATMGHAPALTLGSAARRRPVVLAPMAGITNAAYRRLCAEQGAGLYVCEMITSRGLVEGDQHTKDMLVFDELETVRSVQLYGTDPVYVGKAAEILCAEYGVAHIDLNFGCPVPKVTRKGGGGALPWKRGLLGEILEHAVAAATPYDVPVTMKTRKGIDDDHLTYLDAGRIAQETGVRGDRAARRAPSRRPTPGTADWDAIAALVDHVDIPVLGNGDIWEAADARPHGRADRRRRRRRRPRLPGPAVDLPRPGRGVRRRAGRRRCPTLGEVAAMMRRHAELLCQHMGEERGLQGVPQARLVVPQGLRRRRRDAPLARPRRHARRPRPAARRPGPDRAVPGRRAGHAARSPGLAARPGGRSPRAGSTTPTAAAATLQEDANETTGG